MSFPQEDFRKDHVPFVGSTAAVSKGGYFQANARQNHALSWAGNGSGWERIVNADLAVALDRRCETAAVGSTEVLLKSVGSKTQVVT